MNKKFNAKLIISIIVTVIFLVSAIIYCCSSCSYMPVDNSSGVTVENSEFSTAYNSVDGVSDASTEAENIDMSETEELSSEFEESQVDESDVSSDVSSNNNSVTNESSDNSDNGDSNNSGYDNNEHSTSINDDASIPEQSDDDFVFTLSMTGGTSYNNPYEMGTLTLYIDGVVKDEDNGIKQVTVTGGEHKQTAQINSDGSFTIKVGILRVNTTYTLTFVATNNAGETRTIVRYFRWSVNHPPNIEFSVGSSAISPKYITVNAGSKTVDYTFSGRIHQGEGSTSIKSVSVNGVAATFDNVFNAWNTWSVKLSNLPVNTPIKITVTAVNNSGKTAVYEGYVYFDSPSLTEEKAFAVYSADDGSLTFYNRTLTATVGSAYNGKTVTAIYTGFDVSSYSSASETPWYSVRKSIKSVNCEDKITPSHSTAYWFSGFTECAYINVSKLDVKNVTNMANMFYMAGRYASTLNIIGLENWDTGNVINMENMFRFAGEDAPFLLNLSHWDVSNVTSYANFTSSLNKDKIIAPAFG